jgi:hypothetical protein
VARHVPVTYAFQELADIPAGFAVPPGRVKPWGTGHALLCCAQAVDGPFAVINADDFYGKDSYAVLARFLDETAGDPSRYAMVGYVLRNTLSDLGAVARGVCTTDAHGSLVRITERTRIEKTPDGIRCLLSEGRWEKLTGDELVSMNIWGFKPSIFAHLQRELRRFLEVSGSDLKAEFFLPEVVSAAMQSRSATTAVLRTSSPWFGVTYPQEKDVVAARVAELVRAGVYPERLWA